MEELYTTQKGDTLFAIAQNHNVTIGELVNINPKLTTNGRNIDLIYSGEIIKIPNSIFSPTLNPLEPKINCNIGSKTIKAKKKLKFSVEGKGEQKIYKPKNPNGKTLYFYFGYTGSEEDKKMRKKEEDNLEDIVLASAYRGFKVVYDKAGTKKEFLEAINDSDSYGIYWSGHGYMNGDIQSTDGKVISPSDIDKTKRSSNLKFLILAACGSGKAASKWKKALPNSALFEGWKNTTNISETNDFTSTAFIGDSLISHKGMTPDKELIDYINYADKK